MNGIGSVQSLGFTLTLCFSKISFKNTIRVSNSLKYNENINICLVNQYPLI